MEEKSSLRKKYKSLRDSLLERKEELGRLICDNCARLPELSAADTVLLYYPKGSEADLRSLALMLWKSGRTVGFPRCVNGETMAFHKVSSFSELEPGRFGIMEPSESAPICKTDGAVCFVPALSYDSLGYRLGYGGGYYDRFLSDFSGITAGVTYEACLAKSLPREEHDKKTDYIITESQVKRTIED